MESLKDISFNDEIRIGCTCAKKGLIEFSKFGPSTIDLFIPLLLLSVGFERLLKVLYCFDFFNKNSNYPTNNELKDKGHDLIALTNHFISVCENYQLYKNAQARINDLKYLKNSLDFKQLLSILNIFAKEARYYNLDYISGIEKQIYDPRELISKFLNNILRRYPEINEQISNPPYNSQIVYDTFNPYFVELVQRFLRIICFGFTQGAFGDKAKQLSDGLLDDFLFIRDENLSQINFTL
ncbi:MAG: hypothetical protein HW421_1940 [Ignavibacteria bacterium]|nr:hypothetical protein [Ignavibacteria bacterium]